MLKLSMRSVVAAVLTTGAVLVAAPAALANHINPTNSSLSCDSAGIHVSVSFEQFSDSNKPINGSISVDGKVAKYVSKFTFSGSSGTYSTTLPASVGQHAVGSQFTWPGKASSDHGQVDGTVTCPDVTPTPTPSPTPSPTPPTTVVYYGCDGQLVTPEHPAAVCPGPPGPPGNCTKQGCPCDCTSKRIYRFLLRPTYEGQRIVSATASQVKAKSTKVRVMHKNGRRRLQVVVDARGMVGVKGQVRTVVVTAKLANGHKVRLVQKWRQCAAKGEGNMNDASAQERARR